MLPIQTLILFLQALYDAKKRELESEAHLKIMGMLVYLVSSRDFISCSFISCISYLVSLFFFTNAQLAASKEGERLRLESKKATNELEALKEALNVNQANVFTANQKMEELRNELNWNKQQLDDWLEKTKAIEEVCVSLDTVQYYSPSCPCCIALLVLLSLLNSVIVK